MSKRTNPELPFFIESMPPKGKLKTIDFSDSVAGGKQTLYAAYCPVCNDKRYIHSHHAREGSTSKTTLCGRHNFVRQVVWVPDGAFDANPNIKVDYKRQKVDWNTKSRKTVCVFILGTCLYCSREKWIRYSFFDRPAATTYCLVCSTKMTKIRNDSNEETRRKYRASYPKIHINAVAERYGDEFASLVRKNLYSNKGMFAEHRVVAYKKYGDVMFEKGVVVRHLDGDKRNSSPGNLILGSRSDNSQDHVVDRRNMLMWRSVALALFKILSHT